MKHKLIGTISLAALFCMACNKGKNEKYFSGTVEYAYTFSSDSLNADSLAKRRPAKSLFRYDTTGYQSVFTGQDTATYYYSGKLNRCVFQTAPGGQFQCEDYGVLTDSVLSVRFYDTDEKILGYSCKVLEMQKKNSWVKYYVSTELKIAPATYQGHRSYNWDTYGKESGGGLILKMEHRFGYFTMNGIATGVKVMTGHYKALELSEAEMDKICGK